MMRRGNTNWKWAGASALAVGLALGAAQQAEAETIYEELFTSSADLNDLLDGETPDTGVGTWNASDEWTELGTIPGSNVATDNDSAFLAFTPETGKIYTLSATLTQPTAGVNTGQWAAIGFMETNNDTDDAFWSNNGGAWMLYRTTGDVDPFAGPGVSNGITEDTGVYTGTTTISIVLNTEAALWTAEWFADGDSLGTFNYTTNPTIGYVGLGRAGGASTDFESFSLTVVPEPGSLALLGLGGLLIGARRRRD